MVNKKGAEDVDDEFQRQIIHNCIDIRTDKIVDEDAGTVSTSDENTDGYYLMKWCGNPYTLQENLVNTTFSDNQVIEQEDMVCDAVY